MIITKYGGQTLIHPLNPVPLFRKESDAEAEVYRVRGIDDFVNIEAFEAEWKDVEAQNPVADVIAKLAIAGEVSFVIWGNVIGDFSIFHPVYIPHKTATVSDSGLFTVYNYDALDLYGLGVLSATIEGNDTETFYIPNICLGSDVVEMNLYKDGVVVKHYADTFEFEDIPVEVSIENDRVVSGRYVRKSIDYVETFNLYMSNGVQSIERVNSDIYALASSDYVGVCLGTDAFLDSLKYNIVLKDVKVEKFNKSCMALYSFEHYNTSDVKLK